ncbi:uncharacterized protein LOC118644911 [Monomorium pharaonis]|uniref:uncharacterized protein LOC118644911 n=1 Tax=Monomorium pharaonis TaxID=307658 RepID=UPI001746DC7E|nr:uncharacterized protein LOC118644911 [Monomorium pharaonis]
MRLSHIENRLEQQLTLRDLIVNSVDNLTKVGLTKITPNRVNARLLALKEHWEKFSLVNDAIGLAMTKISSHDKLSLQQHPYFENNVFLVTHECYLDSIEKMTSLLETDSESVNDTPSTQSAPQDLNIHAWLHNSRLPRLDTPKFNGSPEDWLDFKDLFHTMVLSRATLSPVEKLQYLKLSLIGPAARLLKNTPSTSGNFEKAWNAVVSYYENKRNLVSSTLHSLFTLKRLTKESARDLERLYNELTDLYRSFETLNRPIETWDDFLVFIAVEKLDSESVKVWEQHLGSSTEPPTWNQFLDFLLTRLRSVQAYEKSRIGKMPPPQQNFAKSHFQGRSQEFSENSDSCPLCSETHYLSSCPQYKDKSVQQRTAIVSQHNLCYNCLRPHRVSTCRSTRRCLKCGKKHHTTIHRIDTKNEPGTSTSSEVPTANSLSNDTHVLHSAIEQNSVSSCILLATARVVIVSSKGETATARALIDQGSEISLVSEHLVQQLRLPRTSSSISLIGVGAKKSSKTKGLTHFTLKAHFNSDIECHISAYILPQLTTSLPSAKVQSHSESHLNGLTLADPDYTSPGKIDIILGADVYPQIIEEGIRKGNSNSLLAQRTKFGWIISGLVNRTTVSDSSRSYHITMDRELHDLLQKFWKLEEIPSSSISLLSLENQKCEQHFTTTHSRDHEGRYTVRLPFKQSVSKLGDSRAKATRIITSISKKFAANPDYAQAYHAFLKEYEDLHHMERVSASAPEPHIAYYLPHHGVIRENSITTKLRVVFNGSSRTTTGISLNDLLHTGAKLQIDVFDVLTWFRQFQFVFTSDIEKMYRQIKVHKDDWDFQRILWIDKNNKLITFQLSTVTYGLACAPFLALRTIEQLVKDDGTKFPLAIPSLTKGRYVDDIFGGADSIEQAQEIVKQLNQLCTAGGFPLQKWISNHPDILAAIPQERQTQFTAFQFEDTTNTQILGLNWNPSIDNFQFSVTPTTTTIITKRNILSTVAKLFDPLGFLAPVTINAKILIQELWSLKLDWDDSLPSPVSTKWTNFMEQLQYISELSFPRWIHLKTNQVFEFHGFCDASLQAICATVYIRVLHSNKQSTISLVCAKTKVAPIKKMTIPRLELTGAVLLTKLMSHVLRIFEFNHAPLFMWTDSSIVYTWINNHPSRWKDFVHNRVCYIHETLPQAIWKFVPGTENPADCATRGLTPAKLQEHSIWWSGPSWLLQDPSTWPKKPHSPSHKENLEERPIQVSTINVESNKLWDLINRYSKLTRLFRITAICKRFIARLQKSSETSITIPITTQEIESAKIYWITRVQQIAFQKELQILSNGQSLPRSSPLLRLTPVVDSNGLLRVGGRLQFSSLPANFKHPFILPRESPLSALIISDAHLRTMHGGTQLTLSFIRNDYWIIGGRAPIRSFILKCVRCARFRQKRAQQIMGQLPIERLTPSRPFLNSGVDYAGPFILKNWKGRNSRTYKAYIALFVCHSTSALHLELVTDLTTEGFIAAYKRFTSRRGICSTLMSDCGTNLKGADFELQHLFSASSKELGKLASLLSKDGTQWKFIPPASPHFGGKWEAGVKSVKHHLRRVVGNHLLTYEEMSTVITQIEAVLNSRPLCPLTDDPDDLNVLTPGHFLSGGALATLPEPSLENIKLSHLSRWQLTRQMLDSFWTRWSKECLQRYLAMHKWNKVAPPLKKDDLVLVVDESRSTLNNAQFGPFRRPAADLRTCHPVGLCGESPAIHTLYPKEPRKRICYVSLISNLRTQATKTQVLVIPSSLC